MAKGIKNKQKQRWKHMKRQVIRSTKEIEDMQKLGTPSYVAKNAFLYPSDPEAVIPQHKRRIRMDFRSEAITPFEMPVKSKKLFAQRAALVEKPHLVGARLETPDIFMGELMYSIGNIEKASHRKARMKFD